MTAASSSRYYSMCTIWSAKEKLAYTTGVSTNYYVPQRRVNAIMKFSVNFSFYEIHYIVNHVTAGNTKVTPRGVTLCDMINDL